jgi:heparosan-N-sulfate-glucuronate 5-epimerase
VFELREHVQGIDSLVTLLPLFDGGSRSYYDLRHVYSATLAPNIARWDYHTLHIYQLYWLAQILKHHNSDNSEQQRTDYIKYAKLLDARADMWMAYARGERAKHN